MTLIASNQIDHILINQINPNPNQPRRYFSEDDLKHLADSIQQYGIMQPISVRIKGERYELVAGERRYRAAKQIGLASIPAIVLEVNDEDSTILALVENLQRENLNFMEEAEGYFNLIHDYQLTQKEIAEKIGKSQSTIANKLRLLNLSPQVVEIIFLNQLSERHARALLSLENEKEQLKILHTVVKKSLNVKQTEELIQKLINQDNIKKNPEFNVKHYLKDIRIFTNTIKQAVEMMQSSGVEVNYRIEQEEDAYQITIHIPISQDKESL